MADQKSITASCSYHNDLKFSDRQVWANSADPDQTAPSLIRVYTVCNSFCIFWMHYSTVKPSCSNFRVITTHFSGVRIFKFFTVYFLFAGKIVAIVKSGFLYVTLTLSSIVSSEFENMGICLMYT